MKNTLRVLGAVFLVLVVAGIVGGVIPAKEGVSSCTFQVARYGQEML